MATSPVTQWDASGQPITPVKTPPVTSWDASGAPIRNEPQMTQQQSKQSADALIYSNLLNVPPSYAYENHQTITEQLGDRLGEYGKAAWEGFAKDSIVGEFLRKSTNPVFEGEDEPSKILHGIGETVADLPFYLAGAVMGAAAGTPEAPGIGTVIGGGAGAMALPAGIRQILVNKYSKGTATSFRQILDVIKAEAKGGAIGGATAAAGELLPVPAMLAGGIAGKFGGPALYKGAAELATMTTVGDLLEGKVPTANDFLENAAMLAAMHIGMGSLDFAKRSAPAIRDRLFTNYSRDGVHPRDMTAEAGKRTVEPQGNPMEILNRIDDEIARSREPQGEGDTEGEPTTPAQKEEPEKEGLRPVVTTSDGIEEGKPGERHDDVIERTGKDGERAFIDPEGNILNREQARDWVAVHEPEVSKALGEKTALHTEDYNDAKTGIKNAVTEQERADRGMPAVEVEAKRTLGNTFDSAKEAVDSGKIDPRILAEQLAKTPRALNAEESAALIYDRMRLQNEHASIMNGIEDARQKGDAEREARERDRLDKVEEQINTNDEAARKTGYEQGLGLAARKMMIKQDYSLANILQRARVASKDGNISPELRDRLEGLSRQLDEANKRIDAYEQSKKDLVAQQVLDKMKRDEARKQRAGTRAATQADLKTEFDSLLKDLNSELMQLSANPVLNPKLYELFAKLAANRVRAGVVKLEDIVDEIHAQIQEHGISKQQVQDFISEANKRSAKDDIQKELDDAKKQQEKALGAYKTRLTNRIAELENQLASGDFTKPTKRTTVLDSQAEALKAKAEKLKSQVEDAIQKQKFASMSPLEKGAHQFQKWRRAVLLSSVTTLGKLETAAMLRFGTTPIEELLGGVLSQIPGISDIAAKAPREGGGLNRSAEAKAFGQFFEKATYEDMRETVKTGKSSLDYLYGKKNSLPPEALDFFGHLHGALKVLPKRAEFFRSLEKRAQWAIDNHLDIQDPKVQATLAADAYLDANRAIFMQENFINTGFRMLMHYFGEQGLSGKSLKFMTETVLPIVKVPTNIVAESFDYAAGSVTGSIEALSVVLKKDGLKNLSMHQADNIMRSLKKGSLGLALLAIGYYAGSTGSQLIQAGGFYQPGDEKKKIKPESLVVGGVELPPFLQHTPAGMVFEMGATIRRVNDAYTIKGKSGGLVAGAASGALGGIKKVPFIDQAVRAAEALKTADSAGLFIDDLIQSLIVPPDVRRIAQMQDPTKRKPTNLKESIEQGIPGLRQNVPAKKGKKFSIRGMK